MCRTFCRHGQLSAFQKQHYTILNIKTQTICFRMSSVSYWAKSIGVVHTANDIDARKYFSTNIHCSHLASYFVIISMRNVNNWKKRERYEICIGFHFNRTNDQTYREEKRIHSLRLKERKNVTSKRFSTWQIFEQKSHSSADCTREAYKNWYYICVGMSVVDVIDFCGYISLSWQCQASRAIPNRGKS